MPLSQHSPAGIVHETPQQPHEAAQQRPLARHTSQSEGGTRNEQISGKYDGSQTYIDNTDSQSRIQSLVAGISYGPELGK